MKFHKNIKVLKKYAVIYFVRQNVQNEQKGSDTWVFQLMDHR